jgi:predicted O-methyltransferase YrrM
MSVREKLHPVSPYEGFTPVGPPDRQGWNSESPIFQTLIEEVRPRLIIEVGSWKGGSAVTMGKHLARLGLQAELVCVDTWLGAMEFWNPADAGRYGGLQLRHGYPSVYYTFLSNIVHAGLQDVVTPFPLSSVTAALWFRHHAVQADLIYVDASHEEEDVRADLEAYWPVLREGGVMFGDDFVTVWPGVLRATREFSEARQLQLEQHDGFWVLRKRPAAAAVTARSTRTAAHADVLRLAMLESLLQSTFPDAGTRRAFFTMEEVYPLPLQSAVVRSPAADQSGFTLYSPTRFQLHAPAPPASIQLDIPGIAWEGWRRFVAVISVPNADAPDIEFVAKILSPRGDSLAHESIRLSPLAVVAWHFALPAEIPKGSVLSLGTRVAWASSNDYAWAIWSSPLLLN